MKPGTDPFPPPLPPCPQKNYTAAVVAHPVTSNGASLISHVNHTSVFRYNLNAAYFPLAAPNSTFLDALMVRVCNCSWGDKGHSPPMPTCGAHWTKPARCGWMACASWGSTAVALRTAGWNYQPMATESIILDGAVDPRITYRKSNGMYYMTADTFPPRTHLYTSKTPLVKESTLTPKP